MKAYGIKRGDSRYCDRGESKYPRDISNPQSRETKNKILKKAKARERQKIQKIREQIVSYQF